MTLKLDINSQSPTLRLRPKALPFSHQEVNQIINYNSKNQNTIVELEGTEDFDWSKTLNYLSYCAVVFNINSISEDLSKIYFAQKGWFRRNNIVFSYFKKNPKRLAKLLTSFFAPLVKHHDIDFDELDIFSLPELSILEFDEFVTQAIHEFKVVINRDNQLLSVKSSTRRSKVYHNLLQNLPMDSPLRPLLPQDELRKNTTFKFKDTLDKNIGSSSLPLGSSKRNTLNLHLEVLDSCDQTCAGCFVKRKNILPQDWTKDLDRQISTTTFNEWNEVVVGPTDIFSATNFYDIFKEEFWSSGTLSKFSAITFNSTLNYPDKELKTKYHKLKEVFPNKQLEFFIIVDIHNFLAEEDQYMNWLARKLELLQDANIILTINTPEVFFWRFEAPGEIAYRWFNKNFKYTLSFFRSNNKKLITRYLKGMNEKCNIGTNVINYTYDRNFGGTTYTTLVYKNRSIYWAPCIVDFVFIEDPMFKIESDTATDSLRNQSPFGECEECPEKHSCNAKGILAVKDYLHSQDCILPKDFPHSSH